MNAPGINVVECRRNRFDAPKNSDLIEICEAQNTILVTFQSFGGGRRLYSRSERYIADVRTLNPKIEIPNDIGALSIIVDSDPATM
jgi:hypothetical protein